MREAVRSALTQAGEAIEIIVSDDSSTDKTFETLKEECESYFGPHRVTLRQTPHNLGVVGHLNQLLGLANGRLIILGAGDDLAARDKTEKIRSLWRGNEALIIGCNPLLINDVGDAIGRLATSVETDFSCLAIIKRRNTRFCLTAFDRSLFDQFGPLYPALTVEDQALIFRASLIDTRGIKIIDEPLVKYRVHTGSLVDHLKFGVGRDRLVIMKRKLASQESLHRGWLRDLDFYATRQGTKSLDRERKFLTQRLWLINNLEILASKESIFGRLKQFRGISISESTGLFSYLILILFMLSPRMIALMAAVISSRKKR